ncbi:hypothetical protein UMZ34_17770 [Halopseudomonas pachastrellae]|nr:hypothetical protein UMZ34_17770 [Halopseudomonas pachastrellae]
MILTIVLSGEVHFAYDGSEHVLKVNPQRQSRASTAQALAVNLRRLTVFRRQIRRGERDLSKVQLMFNPDWLRRGDSNDPLRRRLEQHLLGQHLASIAWQPDEQVLALCRALLDLRHEPDRLRRSLQAENLAHQVLWGLSGTLSSCRWGHANRSASRARWTRQRAPLPGWKPTWISP